MLIIGTKFLSMMKNYDKSVKINQNPGWPYINYWRSGSGKTNVLLNLIKNQRLDIDKIYLYVKDPFETNCLLMEEKK